MFGSITKCPEINVKKLTKIVARSKEAVQYHQSTTTRHEKFMGQVCILVGRCDR